MENTRQKILFITHKEEKCGVADYGRRLFSILQPHMDITYCDTEPNYEGYDIALYNYHYATLPNVTADNKSVKHIALFHEAHMNFNPDLIINVADLPRPLIEPYTFPSINCDVPVIGSFGFGFPGKGFSRICSMVKEQFKEAIVKFNIPFAHYGDADGHHAMNQVDKCKTILDGSNIQLRINHKFLQQDELLFWLSWNTINLFLYPYTKGRGISSSTDYALSAHRPIGISSSEMFRHLPREICVDNISIPELIEKGIGPLKNVYIENSNEKLVSKIKSILYGTID